MFSSCKYVRYVSAKIIFFDMLKKDKLGIICLSTKFGSNTRQTDTPLYEIVLSPAWWHTPAIPVFWKAETEGTQI